ncbi:MAG: hypothetical protein Q9219_006490 [cf. Caloplaca sp. 3 TL-2023]
MNLITLMSLASFGFASPLNHRRQNTKTVTETATITLKSPSASTSTLSKSPLPIIPADIYSLSGIHATASPVTSSLTISSSKSSSPVPIVPTSLPNPTSSNDADDPCQKFCKTNNNDEAECLANCQVIDGQAQVNAPGLTFAPASPTASSSSTGAAVPIIPTGVPVTHPADPANACKEFCKTDKISELTCLANCQVIDGQVQVNPPGILFPPNTPTASTSAKSPTTSADLDALQKACEAGCSVASMMHGELSRPSSGGVSNHFSTAETGAPPCPGIPTPDLSQATQGSATSGPGIPGRWLLGKSRRLRGGLFGVEHGELPSFLNGGFFWWPGGTFF